MSGFRRIISLYLTAAIILGLVIADFGADKVAFFGVSDSTVTEEAAAESTSSEKEPTDAITESVSESTDVTADSTPTIEYITEEATYTEQESQTEKEEVQDKETAKDGEIIFSELLSYKPQLRNNYKPDTAAEKVTPLLFLSDNVDKLDTTDSVNVYTFTAEKRAVFSYTFTHDAPQTTEGWEISLYCEYFLNGDGGETAFRLVDRRTTTTLTADKSPELGIAPGNYRLVVKKGALFDGKTYKISATLTETANYEIECNDNIYRYTEIYSSVPVKGSASCFPDRQDDDYFFLRTYEDGFIELKFEHPTIKDMISVCWQVLLFSEDGTCVYSLNSLFTDEINRSGKIGLNAGNYYVLIRNRVYTAMTYTLTLSRTDNTDYENEKNDTTETANIIGIGSTLTGTVASQINGIDRDYFRFTAPSNGFVVIDFAHEPVVDADEKQGWNIILLDENGNMLYKGLSAWADDVTVSSRIGIGKGTYFIRIDSENLHLNSEKYYLTVTFEENTDIETEFNNSFDTADTLPEHTPVTGNLAERDTDYDTDFFMLDITEVSDITVELSHEILESGREIFNFTLYDYNHKPVKSYSEQGEGETVIKSLSENEKVSALYKSLPSGRYYVKVTSGIFYSDIGYSLSYIKGE